MFYIIKILWRYGGSIFFESQSRQFFLAQSLFLACCGYSSPKGHLGRWHGLGPPLRVEQRQFADLRIGEGLGQSILSMCAHRWHGDQPWVAQQGNRS